MRAAIRFGLGLSLALLGAFAPPPARAAEPPVALMGLRLGMTQAAALAALRRESHRIVPRTIPCGARRCLATLRARIRGGWLEAAFAPAGIGKTRDRIWRIRLILARGSPRHDRSKSCPPAPRAAPCFDLVHLPGGGRMLSLSDPRRRVVAGRGA
ncbi:MAG: hypothetical protein KGI51_10850 [Rhodospirillales bacterium]|nr:hypothetical protein [Rhodospirillales bacterium]